jgi:hypothetical protein
VGFKPTISAGKRRQTYVLDRAATETGYSVNYGPIKQAISTEAVHYSKRAILFYITNTVDCK